MAITATVSGGAVQLSGNPVRVSCSGASIPTGASAYRIVLKIISQDGKLANAPFIDAKTPDTNGKADFEIQAYLDAPVKKSFQFPITTAYKEYPTQAFKVQVQPGERYIDEDGKLVENWGTTSAVFQILKGGLNPRQISVMKLSSSSFFSTYIQSGKFLTQRPWGDYVHWTQPVKLWYMTSTSRSATFKVEAVYGTGDSDTYSTAVTLNPDYLYEFNCNPGKLGLPKVSTSGNTMQFFDVWLQVGATNVSDKRRFTIDQEYCERPYFMFFANSLGGIDDVYLSGNSKEGFETEGPLTTRAPQEDDTTFEGTIETAARTGHNIFTVNSGWKTTTSLQHLRDLLVAKQVWALYADAATLTAAHVMPIIISTGENQLFDRMNDLHSMDITFRDAHESRFNFDNRIY